VVSVSVFGFGLPSPERWRGLLSTSFRGVSQAWVLLCCASVGGGAAWGFMLSLHYGAGRRFLPSQIVGAVRFAGLVVKRLGKGCLWLSAGEYSGRKGRASEGAFLPHYGVFLCSGRFILRGSRGR